MVQYPQSTPGVVQSARVLRVPQSTRRASREYPVSTLVSTREYLRRALLWRSTQAMVYETAGAQVRPYSRVLEGTRRGT